MVDGRRRPRRHVEEPYPGRRGSCEIRVSSSPAVNWQSTDDNPALTAQRGASEAARSSRASEPGRFTQRTQVPVPVLLTAYGWDPNTGSIRDWLCDQLTATYPMFAHRTGRAEAADLVAGAGTRPRLVAHPPLGPGCSLRPRHWAILAASSLNSGVYFLRRSGI